MSMENDSNTIGNGTRDLPTCRAVSANCATACPLNNKELINSLNIACPTEHLSLDTASLTLAT